MLIGNLKEHGNTVLFPLRMAHAIGRTKEVGWLTIEKCLLNEYRTTKVLY